MLIHRIGKHRGRQRQISAQGHTGQDAYDGKGRHIARAQAVSPDKGGDRQAHAGEPGALFAETTRHKNPQWHAQRAADEIEREEPAALLAQLQHVSHEKHHQRGRNGRGDTVEHKHHQQFAKHLVRQRAQQSAEHALLR